MAFENCIEEIKRAAGGVLNDEQAAQILDGLLRRQEAAMRQSSGAIDPKEALQAAARAMSEDEAAAAALARRNARLNLAARASRRSRIENAIGSGVKMADAVRAEIHGINTPVRGGRFSAEAEWKALGKVYQTGLMSELEHAGLFEVARDGKLERDWARELFELSKGARGEENVTGNPAAMTIARAIHRWQTLAKVNLNKAGAAIGDYSGYIARTSHDADKIRRAGYEQWRDAILPKLDHATTFTDTDNPEQLLQNVYHALVTGVHMTDSAGGDVYARFTGPGNLAKRMSQERVLHFKDADAWLDYNAKFGIGTPIEDVINSLDRAARQTALMRRWGTNPRAEFDADLRWLQETHRDTSPEAVRGFQSARQDLQNRFDFLDGTANIPVNHLAARIASATRIWTSMAKLGGVLFTHLSVIGTKPAELHYRGVGLLEGYRDALASITRGRGRSENAREVMDLLGAGLEGMHRDIVSRFTPDDTMPGTLSKLANTFFKWTGLTYMLNAQRAGAEWTMARHLGSLVDRRFADLPSPTARSLEAIGIGDKEWGLLRGAENHTELDGRTFLTPDAGTRISDDALEPYLAPQLRRIRGDAQRATSALRQNEFYADNAVARQFQEKAIASRADASIAALRDRTRQDLALRLHAYYTDTADRSIITPGVAEKAVLLQGTRPGTPLGEALRFVAQFKQWPAAVIRQGLGREIYGGKDKIAASAGILHMALASSVLGYLAMSAKDLAKGREPRDPRDAKTWAASVMQGGGLGILGDFLFGEYNRFGQNFSETVLGPVLGEGLGTMLDLWNRAKNGQDLAPEAFNAALNNTPFINLFYTRLALDYLFLWQTQEALNPGFLQRFERRVRQQNDQGFWLPPTSVIGR